MGALFCLLVTAGGLVPRANAAEEYDRTTLVVKLAPTSDGARRITKGQSGRPDFDRIIADFDVATVRQVFPPTQVPAHRRDLAQKMRMADFVIVRVPDGVDPDALKYRFEKSSGVEKVEFDRIVRICAGPMIPNDTYFSTHQYALHNDGTQPPYDPGTAGADCEMEAAWAITTGDTNVVLAIIDTGLDYLHSEFAGRLWNNTGEEFDDIDNDSNGKVDDVFGWNFVGNNNSPRDDHEHGTHVAGIAAANGNNGVGIAGINWHCRIMPLKALGADGSGTSTNIAAAIEYAADMGADVISMSLGYTSTTGGADVESLAVLYAVSVGVTVVAAIGNDDNSLPHYPSAYPNVIAVGATDPDDHRADPFCWDPQSGSNYGSYIDVCAPGGRIWSTLPGFAVWPSCDVYPSGGYGDLSGTSMATPHVSGLACLVKALRPGWPPDSVARVIRLGAEDQVGRPEEDTPGFDVYHGWGRINGRITLQSLALAFPPILSVPGPQTVTEADTLRFTVTASDSNFTYPVFSIGPLANASVVNHGDGTAEVMIVPDYDQQGAHQLVIMASDGALADTDSVAVTILDGCRCQCHGDPICDAIADLRDVVKAVDMAFRGGAPILDVDCPAFPGGRADVNCDGVVTVVDVVRIVDTAFRGQPPDYCDPCL
ncbi:MAG: S8 family peptidase [Candidatus Zixiibacteriota bacterium]